MSHREMTWKKIRSESENNSKLKWTSIVLLAGVSSLYIDCCFMYVRSVAYPNSIYMDWQLAAGIAISRSVADFIFLCGIILKFHTAGTPSKFNVFGGKSFNKEAEYSKSSVTIDLIAILPIAQFLVGLKSESLVWWVNAHLAFKVIAMSPRPEKVATMTGIVMKNAWFGAMQNLLFFITISNAVGAFYYDSSLYPLQQCRNIVIREESDAATLDWDELIIRCTQKYNFESGIYSDALTAKIGTRTFIQKYTFCLAWGLKSFSSFGQIFSASSYTVDTLLSFFIVVIGLVLFGDLLAKMQTGLQCSEEKEDRHRARQRLVEEWMKYHQLPQHLKGQVKKAIQSEWTATRGVNDETMLDSLPWDVRCEIRRHLYLEIVRTMPVFAEMDDHLINAICGYLRTISCNEGTYVAFEGEPVRQLLFVFSGQLEISTANNSEGRMILGPGDLCGRELLKWSTNPTTSTENLQLSTLTAKCITDVDAFSLRADDVKLLAIRFHCDGTFRRAFQQFVIS